MDPSRQLVVRFLKDVVDEPDQYEELIFKKSTDDTYFSYVYEKIGELKEAPELKERILNDIETYKRGWDSCLYDKYRTNQTREISKIVEGIKVEKGEFPCRNKNCRSKECYFYEQQTRSADEPATVFVVCTKCNTRYKF